MKRVLSRLLCGGVLVALTATGVLAQATAQITGIVKDPSGGVLPGASVTATQTETGFKREVVTDAEGLFSFPGIPVGPYRLEVMLQGFRASVQTGILLQVNANPVVPVTLALGEVAETITVQANAQVVETRNLGVGQVMDNKRILDLPLNGRNPADLLQYLPASVPQVQVLASSVMGGSNGGQAYSLAGGLAFGVTYVLDGAMHNDPRNNLNLPLPFPDALQEFQAETNALTAQNGMHSGAAVNAVTKSGTNTFRGDAFEFLRHHSFNATDPFGTKNPDGSRKDDGLKRNQYGAHDRRAHQDRPAVLLLRLSGDEHLGESRRTTARSCRRPRCWRVISRRSPRRPATPVCSATSPRPSSATGSARRCSARRRSTSRPGCRRRRDPCGLLQYGLPSATDEGQYVSKIDYTINAKHSLFGRYVATTQFSPPPFTLESAQQNVLATRIGGRDNNAQSVHDRRELCHQPDHAERGSLCLQPDPHQLARTSTSFPRRRWASTATATCRTTCC